MSSGCGPLFRLGLVSAGSVDTRQIVSRRAPVFVSFLVAWPQRAAPERAPFGFGFDFRSAEPQNFVGILYGLSFDVIPICGEEIEHMPELMKEDQNLGSPGIARVRPHVGPARTTTAHNDALLPDFNHHR